MQKREFMRTAGTLVLGAMTATGQAATVRPAVSRSQKVGQVVLTVTGAIDRSNRGALDPVTDQLMHKHGLQFARGYILTLSDLDSMTQATIHPTMEYDGKAHQLSGPLLADVLQLVGIVQGRPTRIRLHGIDGYSPEIDLDQARRYNPVLATRLDGTLMAIGGFGPVFAIHDADRIPELAQLPLPQRFVTCPWGLYCIELV